MKASKKQELEALKWFVNLALDTKPIVAKTFLREWQDKIKSLAPEQITYNVGNVHSHDELLEYLRSQTQETLFAIINRQRVALRWPEWRALEWDKKQGYIETPNYSYDNIEKVTLRLLISLLRRHWRLLKRCNAYLPGSIKAKCETLFVAERSTAAYCSSTCKYRTFKRNARNPKNKAKVKSK